MLIVPVAPYVISHCAVASRLPLPTGVTGTLTQPEIGESSESNVTLPVTATSPVPLGSTVAVMRNGTPSAAGTTGNSTTVGLGLAAAGAAVTAPTPAIDAIDRHAIIRARRIPPPLSCPLPRDPIPN